MLILIKKVGISILISGKVDFRAEIITSSGHFIMIKWSVHQVELIVLNNYAPNNRASEYMSQTDRTERRTRSTIIVGNFNSFLSII